MAGSDPGGIPSEMRRSGLVGILLLVAGVIIAVVSLGTRCYATVVPGIVPSGPSCSETLWVAVGGAFIALFGVVLTVRGHR
jgi:hypothetical protein